MSAAVARLAEMLIHIEVELRQQGLFAEPNPTAKITQPFGLGEVDFHEWICWVMLPQFKQMIERGDQLPTSCAIAAFAEEAFKNYSQNTDQLVNLIKAVDEIITNSPKD